MAAGLQVRIFPALFLLFISTAVMSVSASAPGETDINFSNLDTTDWDWSDSTHGKLGDSEVEGNLARVFDASTVQKIRIVIEPHNWALMNENLSTLIEELGPSRDYASVPKPVFVPCEIFYDDTQWYRVGIRFKGNSSLFSARSGKLPFKLDFDEFEDVYPDIDNQRFYGFKQLNLKNNYKDASEMREVVAGQLLREFGLVAAHSSFYEVYLNTDGSGDESSDIYFGLYTLVEEVDDTVIDLQYDEDDGNLYKPDGNAATFAEGSYDESGYRLKTDDDSFTDIRLLYETINSPTRLDDPATWKAGLESIFDVDIFLKSLAAMSVMQNWDTYGVMTHNYYLYRNPETGRFEWITWDNNEALDNNRRCLPLSMSNVGGDWPLIRFLLNVEEYKAIYRNHVFDFAGTLLNDDSGDMRGLYTFYSNLIEDSVISETPGYTLTSARSFSAAVQVLINHTGIRYAAAMAYSTGIE